MPDNFEALLGELTLLKSMPADEGGEGAGEGEGEGEGEGDEGGAGAGEGGGDTDGDDVLGKSFTVKLEDGTETEAYDGTEMMKALGVKMTGLQSDRDNLMKALGLALEGMKAQRTALVDQGKLIKSLQDQVAKLGSQGTGRRSILTVMEKPNTTVPENKAPQIIGRDEFMSKALSLQKRGVLEARDIARCEASLNKLGALPDDLKSHFA